MINKIAKRLAMMRLAAGHWTANGTYQEEIKFTEQTLKGIASLTANIILGTTNYQNKLRDIFTKKYNAYRKSPKINKPGEEYELPAGPGMELASQFLEANKDTIYSEIIDEFMTMNNGKFSALAIPYNVFKNNYPKLCNFADKYWLNVTDKFAILPENTIRENLRYRHRPLDTETINTDIDDSAYFYTEDEDNGFSANDTAKKKVYTKEEEDKDFKDIAEQINLFKQIPTVTWERVKEEFKRKGASYKHSVSLFYPEGITTYVAPEFQGKDINLSDEKVWKRNQEYRREQVKINTDICAQIPKIWEHYDKLVKYDPKHRYTEDEINKLRSLRLNTPQYQNLKIDIYNQLLADKKSLNTLIEKIKEGLSTDDQDTINAETTAANIQETLSQGSNSILNRKLTNIFADKIDDYRRQINEFLRAYWTDVRKGNQDDFREKADSRLTRKKNQQNENFVSPDALEEFSQNETVNELSDLSEVQSRQSNNPFNLDQNPEGWTGDESNERPSGRRGEEVPETYVNEGNEVEEMSEINEIEQQLKKQREERERFQRGLDELGF